MDIAATDRMIADYAAGVLLRYFNSVAGVAVDRPAIEIERDRELLRLHWSLSQPVAELVQYVLEHKHEIQSVLDSRLRIEDGIVRGCIDARETVRLRLLSGVATKVVSREPSRSYASPPNQVLAWVLSHAWSLAMRFATITLDSAAYRAAITQALQGLEQVRRIHSIARIADQTTSNRRPTANAVLEAGRSRRTLYRMAVAAYKELLAIEAGFPDAIASMLRKTLLAPLEPWRRFELAVALGVSEQLALVTSAKLTLNLIVGDVRMPVAEVGRYAIYWQWRTDHYRAPLAEPSEQIANDILEAYGLSAASDRPDIVIVDRVEGVVAAIIEAKYLTGEDASDRIRAATYQLVRYARGYRDMAAVAPLLEQCLIAVSQGIPQRAQVSPSLTGVPMIVDFADIRQKALADWAIHLHGRAQGV